MIESDRRGYLWGNLKREGVQEAEISSYGSLNVSKEMGLAKETTSRGAEGRLTSGLATPWKTRIYASEIVLHLSHSLKNAKALSANASRAQW